MLLVTDLIQAAKYSPHLNRIREDGLWVPIRWYQFRLTRTLRESQVFTSERQRTNEVKDASRRVVWADADAESEVRSGRRRGGNWPRADFMLHSKSAGTGVRPLHRGRQHLVPSSRSSSSVKPKLDRWVSG